MESLFDDLAENNEQVKADENAENQPKNEKWRDEYFKAQNALKEKDEELKKYKEAEKEKEIKAKAEKTGQSIEELKAEQEKIRAEAAREERAKIESEYQNKIEVEKQLAKDMADIKAKYPDEKRTSVQELGGKFLRLMLTGDYTAVEAYELCERKPVKKVVTTGSTESTGGAVDKDFFTAEEVKAMSPQEVAKNFDKIEKSIKKW